MAPITITIMNLKQILERFLKKKCAESYSFRRLYESGDKSLAGCVKYIESKAINGIVDGNNVFDYAIMYYAQSN